MDFSPTLDFNYLESEEWKENLCTSHVEDSERRTSSPPFVTSAGEEIDSPPDIKVRPKRETQKSRDVEDEDGKPSYSYIALISMAILEHPDRRMMLGEIYKYITDKFSYYRNMDDRAWRNSIRHNLSLNECFIKCGRADNGKGNYWSIHPACTEDFKKGDFRRRQARRRARKTQQNPDISQLPISYRSHLGYVPMSNICDQQKTNSPLNVSNPYLSYLPYTYATPSGYNFNSSAYPSHSPYFSRYGSQTTPPTLSQHNPARTEFTRNPPSVSNRSSCSYASSSQHPLLPTADASTQSSLAPSYFSNQNIMPSSLTSSTQELGSNSCASPDVIPSPPESTCRYSQNTAPPPFNPFNPYSYRVHNNKNMTALKDAC